MASVEGFGLIIWFDSRMCDLFFPPMQYNIVVVRMYQTIIVVDFSLVVNKQLNYNAALPHAICINPSVGKVWVDYLLSS